MNINGLTNKVDVINSIIDNIDNNELATAKDSLNLLKEIEENEAEAHNPKGKYKYVGDKLIYEEKLNEQMKLPLEEPEDSKIDTMLELENEMSIGK